MAKKPKIGRPKLPAAQRRDRQPRPLYIKLTPAEREAIDAGAAAAGETVSAWARRHLLKAAKR